jgi:hypothetical protein
MLRLDQILDRIDTSQMYMFDRADFLLYCDHMMFGVYLPDIPIQPYYRALYKYIEMLYEEQFQRYNSL